MLLPSLDLPRTMDTSSADLVNDFFVPALAVSSQYDRGVGYFSSGWLQVAASGLGQFASNGGKARWVTSPILAEDDWEALQWGDAARSDPVVYAALGRTITDLTRDMKHNTLSALAWMIADEIIAFKL